MGRYRTESGEREATRAALGRGILRGHCSGAVDGPRSCESGGWPEFQGEQMITSLGALDVDSFFRLSPSFGSRDDDSPVVNGARASS